MGNRRQAPSLNIIHWKKSNELPQGIACFLHENNFIKCFSFDIWFLSVNLFITTPNVKCYTVCFPLSPHLFWGLSTPPFVPADVQKSEIKNKEKNNLTPPSHAPLCSCLGRCVPMLFVYFGKEGPLSACLELTNIGLTAANCALQQPPCSLADEALTHGFPPPHNTWSNTVVIIKLSSN